MQLTSQIMPSVHLQEKNRILLGDPYTRCIAGIKEPDEDSEEQVAHHTYDPTKCNANRLYKKIYLTCNCILRYIYDIKEFFPNSNEYRTG